MSHLSAMRLTVHWRRVVSTFNEEYPALKRYKQKARFFPFLFNPSLSFPRVVRAGLGMENLTPKQPYIKDERDAFGQVLRHIPNFSATVLGVLKHSTKAFVNLIDWMDDGKDRGRMDGTKYLNAHIREIILPNPKSDKWEGVNSTTNKSAFGFNDKRSGRLLIPIRLVGEFDADPEEFLAKMRTGKVPIKSGDIPTFMYPFGHLYNAKDLLDGFAESEIMKRSLNLVLTGPSTLFGGDRTAPQPSVSFKNRHFDVTPHDVGLVAMLVWNALSSSSKWKIKHGKFNLNTIHTTVVNILSKKHKRVLAILERLTKAVPNLGRGPRGEMTGLGDDDEDDDDAEQDALESGDGLGPSSDEREQVPHTSPEPVVPKPSGVLGSRSSKPRRSNNDSNDEEDEGEEQQDDGRGSGEKTTARGGDGDRHNDGMDFDAHPDPAALEKADRRHRLLGEAKGNQHVNASQSQRSRGDENHNLH
ncbi:hypothetical protein BKA70DRAFT_1434379 [Coprinopsis sp. MPI-PUGE-AT-0042]|nr:hypothetical protein BKA70DRAFT_1434379 [Coprinopsis sp. MPI-PUGE-AT-0042]